MDVPENITIGYMVARPKGQDPSTPKRICFIYTYVNDTYSWTVDLNSCRRNIRPGHAGVFKFQSVKTGENNPSFPKLARGTVAVHLASRHAISE